MTQLYMIRTNLVPETVKHSVREQSSPENGPDNRNKCYIKKEYLIDSSQHMLDEKEITTMTGSKSDT